MVLELPGFGYAGPKLEFSHSENSGMGMVAKEMVEADIIVAQDDSGHFCGNSLDVIQEAIDEASSGDWIHVKQGEYGGDGLEITKTLKLTGVKGMSQIKADGNIKGVEITGNNVVFEGFVVENSRVSGAGVVMGYPATQTILRDLIIQNTANYGITDTGAVSHTTVVDCFFSNTAVAGVSLEGEDSLVMGCRFNGTKDGIRYVNTSGFSIIDNFFESMAYDNLGGHTSDAISCENVYNGLIRGNRIITGFRRGIYVQGGKNCCVSGNIIVDGTTGIYVNDQNTDSDDGPAVVTGNTIRDCTTGIKAEAPSDRGHVITGNICNNNTTNYDLTGKNMVGLNADE